MNVVRLGRRLSVTLGAWLVVACSGGGPSRVTDTETSSGVTSDAKTSSEATSEVASEATSEVTSEATPTTEGPLPDMATPEPCVSVRAIFFDLGDTLVVSDGGDLFVERPGASATIAALKAMGMRVGIITNTPAGYTRQDLEGLLADPGLLDAFEVVLLSSEAASPPKPDPQIFAEAHGLLNDAPPIAEVAFVSENLAEMADQAQAPTQGARAAGMVGIHLSPEPPSPLADYTIAPDELETLLSLAEAEWLACDGSR